MNKTIYATALLLVLTIASVSAWHCVDTDQEQPRMNSSRLFGAWGNDKALGGQTFGWADVKRLPTGCTTKGEYQGNCTDFCDKTTLTEFYCSDRPGHKGETTIQWKSYEKSPECGYTTGVAPEMGGIGAALVIACVGVFIFSRRKA